MLAVHSEVYIARDNDDEQDDNSTKVIARVYFERFIPFPYSDWWGGGGTDGTGGYLRSSANSSADAAVLGSGAGRGGWTRAGWNGVIVFINTKEREINDVSNPFTLTALDPPAWSAT